MPREEKSVEYVKASYIKKRPEVKMRETLTAALNEFKFKMLKAILQESKKLSQQKHFKVDSDYTKEKIKRSVDHEQWKHVAFFAMLMNYKNEIETEVNKID
jgi:hypothetical protein